MTQAVALSDADIREELKALNDWSYESNAIGKTYTFPSFLRGIEFVNSVAHLAERQDHHPDMDIRWTNVTIRYWTHTAKGVTTKDIAGAKEVEQIYTQLKKMYPQKS
jgi:4a-hydroxytetrahydrobiopterin dehydratase